ncbi:MAG: hypothetical protein IAE99_09605 [Rhodothermales bacterium]|nr:hypothetical protein [Rhodothermales bacterium]
MKPMLLVCAAVLGGCSSAGDAYRFPPALSELRAELGTTARGTMRIRDYDRNSEYTVRTGFYVDESHSYCSITLAYHMMIHDGQYDRASLRFMQGNDCDLASYLRNGPYPSASNYAGATQMRGEYMLENDSTISGVFYVEMKPSSTGLLPLGSTRRIAATFTAKRVTEWPAP